MCEPNHSINQFPDTPEVGPKVQSAFERITEWAKKIGSWFHFSKMGMGHSESIQYNTIHGRFGIPEPTRYEVAWWRREFMRDGGFCYEGRSYGSSFGCNSHYGTPPDPVIAELAQDAFDSAKVYADQVSIGSLSIFRRFFETSVKKSELRYEYFNHFFYDMLNRAGQLQLEEKIRRVFGRDRALYNIASSYKPQEVDALTKMCLGFTRKRNLLVPEWADEAKLWLPAGT